MSSSISRTFKLSLIQLGNITSNKQENLLRVKDKILNNLNVFKSDIVVLPVGIHLIEIQKHRSNTTKLGML